MKKLFILLLLLTLSTPCHAFGPALNAVVGTSSTVGASCTTSTDSALFDWTGNTDDNPGYVYSGNTQATRFNLSAATTITEYKWNVHSVSVSGSFTVALYTDSSNTIGSVVSNTSKTQTIDTTGINTFTLDTPKTGLSGDYWLVISNSDSGSIQTKYSSGGKTGYYLKDGASYYSERYHRISVMGCAE